MRLVYVANGCRQCGRCHRAMNWNCGLVGRTAHPIACLFCQSHHLSPWAWVLNYMQAAQAAVTSGRDDTPPF